jgi:hypothetical protein
MKRTFPTVERKSAASRADVVREVSRAKSSAADRVIWAALRLSPVRLLSPPARSLDTGKPSAGMSASDREITNDSDVPPANHILCRMSTPAAARPGGGAGATGGGAGPAAGAAGGGDAAGGLTGDLDGLAGKEGYLVGE